MHKAMTDTNINQEGMSKRLLYSFIIAAFIMIAIGIWFAFINLDKLSIDVKNDGFVSAIFSLSGIILYFTALMFQIKEYKLQVVELKKSVEAQTKSSEALDEQKRILLEQNVSTQIFGMIDSFNDFKVRNETDKIINGLMVHYQNELTDVFINRIVASKTEKQELNSIIAEDIKEVLSNTIVNQKHYLIFKKYIQFIYNILI